MIFSPDYFLNAAREWPLGTPLCLCIDNLVVLGKLLRLWLIVSAPVLLLVSLMVGSDNILL